MHHNSTALAERRARSRANRKEGFVPLIFHTKRLLAANSQARPTPRGRSGVISAGSPLDG